MAPVIRQEPDTSQRKYHLGLTTIAASRRRVAVLRQHSIVTIFNQSEDRDPLTVAKLTANLQRA